ncbi:MAG: citrate/2-methylcitrate synthase, partial [Planctomycetota bacterium]
MSTTTAAPVTKGLEGVIAGETEICNVEQSALIYRGYEIADLATNATFEEVAFLLLEGHKPSADELKRFTAELVAAREIPEEARSFLKHSGNLVKNHSGVPMDLLRTAVSICGHLDPDCQDNSADANLRKAKRILAQVPTIIGHMQNNIDGRDFVAQDPNLSHAANLLWMMTGEKPTAEA